MSLEDNKQIVRNYFELINKKENQKAFELLSEDLNWWIIGKAKVSGVKDKRLITVGFKMIQRAFESFQFILYEFTAEENRVAVTAESKGKHSSGKDYNNHYHFLFTIENGKIAKVKEYLDTEHAIWIENG
ncbi:MAG: nuclear transport factor 2 family protein [Leptospiraceae bacterium]|nr:nuclear transport factor 2 family protein [Leptospiraceae bacterium]